MGGIPSQTVGRVLYFSDCPHMDFLENRAKINCKKFVSFAFRWEQIRTKTFILFGQSLAKIGQERETKTEKKGERARKKKNGRKDTKRGEGTPSKNSKCHDKCHACYTAFVYKCVMLAMTKLWKQKHSLL